MTNDRDMAYIKMTISLKPRTRQMLQELAKQRQRNYSNIIDILIQKEYETLRKTPVENKEERLRRILDDI
jgi:flagellar basal body-associated protein FliL